ncbi:MAG: T9SS type A sorting domain-containing protein [Bacteroidota bacterium]
MKKIFTLFVFTCILVIGASAQTPTPLDSSDFPHPYDSVYIRTSRISPTESFTDSISANDTLSIDRCLQKALIALGDNFMSDIQTGGAGMSWNVVTFYYTSLPNPNNWKKIWYTPNAFVPGSSTFPTANLYYQGTTSGYTTYNYFRKTDVGFYELGSRVMSGTPYNIVNTPQKPGVLFPVDYDTPNNIVNQTCSSTASGVLTDSKYSVTVDAYGTVTLVTGTIPSPIYTNYTSCIRTMLYSIDTMDAGSGMLFFLKTKIYNWYAPGIPEPLVTYSVAQVRNNIDPAFWGMDPSLPWHDELEMSFAIPYPTSVGVNEVKTNQLSIFPNPTTGKAGVLVPEEMTLNTFNYSVTDITGRLILQGIQPSATRSFNLNLQGNNAGVYFISMQNEKNSFKGKIILQ